MGKVCLLHPEQEGLRYVASYGCVVCAVIAVKKNQAKNLDVVHARNKQYREANPEKIRKMHQDWRAVNVVHDAERKVAYRIDNSAAVKARYKQYYTENYPQMRAKNSKRHADSLNRTPAWLDADDFWMMAQAHELAVLRTKMFGFPWHVDHVIPLRGKKVSGLHVPINLQVVPGIDNLRKSNGYEVV